MSFTSYNLRQYEDRSFLLNVAREWIRDKYTSGSYIEEFLKSHNVVGVYVPNFVLLINYIGFMMDYIGEENARST